VYLKRIELLGFKSFPTKTQVRFSHGVTAIVGPNGCGKTNVLDALRWVLGEQKPTLMRGGKMEEVIFNGTRDMKPLGMSEVTLTVVNDNGTLPTEYHELQITRRLFRSGESEYLINKVPCRLRDIIDLFADTGLGAHSYSVIQQHMIDSVISDKAEERRFLFEEAAGITKYKQRRKAALRKLEATENDFLRLKDVYAEVKTRVNSLYRQHKKAERYKKLTDLIKAWDLYLGATRLKGLEQQKRELKAEFDSLSDQKSSRSSSLDVASGQLEADRKELLDIEHQLTAVGEEIYNISEGAHRLEREISVLGEKKSNAQQLITKNHLDLEGFEVRSEELAKEQSAVRDQLEQQTGELRTVNEQLATAQTDQGQSDQALLEARMAREAEHKRLLELEGRLSSGKAEESSLKEQTEELADMARKLDEEISAAQPRQKELIERIDGERSAVSEISQKRTDLERRKTELAEEIERCREKGEDLALELSQLNASLEATEARRDLLEDMILHYEGYESGVVATMEERERWPQIAGTVADCFVPVEGMEEVLQAALGEMSKYLICHDREAARQVIQYLRTERKGKVGILVPRSGTLTPAVKRPDMDLPGVIGWLDNHVSSDETLKPLKEAVLSRTLVFEAGADADAILERLPYGFSAVSTDGVLYRNNMISGGFTDDFPLFRRKEKVAEQKKVIGELQERIADTDESRRQNTIRMGELRAESGQVASQLEDVVEDQERQQKNLAESEFSGRSLSTELERLTRDKQNLVGRLENVRGRQFSLGLDANQLATQKEGLLSNIETAGARLEELERSASNAANEVSRLQVAAIEARSRVEQTEHRIGHIQELLDDIKNSNATKTAEIDQATRDIELAEQTSVELEQSLKASFERREERAAVQEQLRANQTELLDRTSEKESQVKQMRQEREAVADKLHEIDIRLTSVTSDVAAMIDRVRQEYEIDITQGEFERPVEKNVDITDDQAPGHVSELKERLRKFGAVNLLALEEYEVANEREKFLSTQLTDLTTAKNDLRSTITKINRTARQLFNETFAKVQENFSNLFIELFAGGEAHISLIDPDDPLESDVEIIARPGGKKLLPITMLSGGERALTAISLLFSLYLVKPSPFCILDEIDAPLDDANCQRFLKIIKSFSRQTQFIIITHNKITMEASDNLYGITMERPGVSKLVAVQFARGENGDADELVAIDVVGDEAPSPPSDLEELPEAIRERIEPGVSVKPDDES
jgi:chromosome segregation protein